MDVDAKLESIGALQTGQFRRRVIDRLSGLETLDLSVAEPESTKHLRLIPNEGAAFRKKTKDFSFGSAWQIAPEGNGLQLELQLPAKFGLGLILELCRTNYSLQADQPVCLQVNKEEWALEIDPHSLNFNKQSCYLPHYAMREGVNNISLRLADHCATQVLVKSVSVMRFDIEKQRRGNWCWAAVTTSLLNYFNPNNELTQCDVVKECFSITRGFETETDCCQHSRKKECNKTFKLGDALDIMGFMSSRCNYPLSLEELRHQINQGAPVGVRIGWQGGGGHFVIITAVGHQDKRGDDHTWVRVADPKDPAASYITYWALKNRYKGEGKWTHSYVFEKERQRRK